MDNETVWYKIVDIKNDKVLTLFHGVNGSKTLPKNQWVKAEKKIVSDGKSTKYLSGFHVVPSHEESVEYLKMFKNVKYKKIIPVFVRGEVRKKEHSPSNIWLADEIFII